uniref:Uncharacterized protein n=1 Tax=Rhizobium rhizogenes TaxID=359 RepID=A0A7S5DS06_RHIRH|nr:hypothetical protein pC5.8b_435 [Rhizobium rhizogenes]
MLGLLRLAFSPPVPSRERPKSRQGRRHAYFSGALHYTLGHGETAYL